MTTMAAIKGKTTTLLFQLAFAASLAGFVMHMHFSAADFARPLDLPVFSGAVSLMLLAHLLRILRLKALWSSGRMRALFIAHSLSIAPGAAFPLKLGEGARIILVGRLQKSLRQGLATVWAERIFDSVFILLALVLLGSAAGVPVDVSSLSVLFVFVLLSFFMIMTGPSTLSWIRHSLIRAPETGYTIPVLRKAVILDRFIVDIPRIVSAQARPAAFLTCAIWSLEWLALTLAIKAAVPEFILASNMSEIWTTATMDGVSTYIMARGAACLVLFFPALTMLTADRLKGRRMEKSADNAKHEQADMERNR